MKFTLSVIFMLILSYQLEAQSLTFQQLISLYEKGDGQRIDESTAEKFFSFSSKNGGWIETGKIVLRNPSTVVLSYEIKNWGASIRAQSFNLQGKPISNILFENFTGDLSFWNERNCLHATDSLFIFRNTEQDWADEDERNLGSGFKKIQLEWVAFNEGFFAPPVYTHVNPKRKYYIGSSDFLTHEILEDYSSKELSIMRNEIFAGHGYIFRSDKWKEYFSKQEWYKPKYEDVTQWLSMIERHNIELLLKLEKS